MKFTKLTLPLLALAFGALHAAETEKPNIILILSDDQGFPDYGFMGHQAIKTPHLDKMASDSLLYTRGYVMPVCSPSLACLLTGKLPHQNGITGNDLSGKRKDRSALAKQLLGNAPLLPQAVTDAGYLTFQTGKLWNVTYQDVGFTDGMTDTAGRHGDAGLEIGRNGMKPIYDFIEKARAARSPSSSGTPRFSPTHLTIPRRKSSPATRARARLRQPRNTMPWSIGLTRPAASSTTI